MLLYEELSNKKVGAFFSVHNALFFELKSIGLNVVYNASLNVFYKGELQALMLIHERACIYTSMYIGW